MTTLETAIPPGVDPKWLIRTSDKAVFNQITSDDPAVTHVLDILTDDTNPDLYPKALAARALSAICLKVPHAKGKLLSSDRWGQLVDTLLDLIGACNDPKVRQGLTEGDRNRVRRNLCLALSILMDDHTKPRTAPSAAAAAATSHRKPANYPKLPPAAEPPDQPSGDEAVFLQWLNYKMEPHPAKVTKVKRVTICHGEDAGNDAHKEGEGEGEPPPPSRNTKLVKKKERKKVDGGEAADGKKKRKDDGSIKDLMRHIKHITPQTGSKARGGRATHGSSSSSRDVTKENKGVRPPPAPPRRQQSTRKQPLGQEPSMVSSVTNDHDLDPQQSSWASETGNTKSYYYSSNNHQPAPLEGAMTRSTLLSSTMPCSTPMDSQGHRGPIVGYFYKDKGPVVTKVDWRQNGPDPRPSVIFGDRLTKDTSWAPNSTTTDFFDKDRRLGYQVPRLWFPQSIYDGDRRLINVPQARPNPLDNAQHPFGSGLVVKEHHQIKAYHNFEAIHQLSVADPNFHSTFDQETWEGLAEAFIRNEDLDNFCSEWSPRHGNVKERLKWKNKRKPGAAQVRQSEQPSPLRSRSQTASPSPKRSRTTPRPATRPITPCSASRPRSATTAARASRVAEPKASSSLLVGSGTSVSISSMEKKEMQAAMEAKAELKRIRLQSVLHAPDSRDVPGLLKVAEDEKKTMMRVIEVEMEAVTDHAEYLQQSMLQQIEGHRIRMPWSMHMEFEGGAALIKQRLVRAFSLWAREFERSQMVMALGLWRLRVDEMKYVKETKNYYHIAGRDRFLTLFRRLVYRRKWETMEKLIYKVACLIWEERDTHVIRIQRQYRRWKGYKIFLRMHDARPYNGELADVFLDKPRYNVQFFIDHRVRSERRRVWQAAVMVQKEWRKRGHRMKYLRYIAACVKIQSYVRMWSDRRAFIFLRQTAVRIQASARMLLAKWKYQLWKRKAIVIQRYIRGHLGRAEYYRRKYLPRKEIEKLNLFALKIQCAFRVFRGRKVARAIREYNALQFRSVLKIQMAWYRYTGAFSTFLLLSCLREYDRLENEFKQDVNRRYRYYSARKIQRVYLRYYHYRRETAAVRLQCFFRGAMGYDLVTILRREKWAARKLHHWARGMMKRKHRAANLIAFWWFKQKPGRLLRHLEIWNKKEEEREEAEESQRYYDAAAQIQAIVHGIWTRRDVKIVKRTIQIQKIIRGFLGRRKAMRRFCEVQGQRAALYINRIIREVVRKEAIRVFTLRMAMATKIQKVYRGHLYRLFLKQAWDNARLQTIMAMRIQKMFRAHRRVVEAFRCMSARRREVTNPFKHVKSVGAVLRKVFRTALTKYHPENEQVGSLLLPWLRRLGAPEIMPLLKAARVERLEQLRFVDEGKLRRMGIEEKMSKGVRSGVFQADALRQLLLRVLLMLDVPPHLRPKSLRDTYNGFCFIEGPLRASTIKKLYSQAYGDKLVVRADALINDLQSVAVTILQLKRFFAMYNSASKAKDNQGEITMPESKAERDWERARVLGCTDMLQCALERLCHMLPCTMVIAPRLQAITQSFLDHLAYLHFQVPFFGPDGDKEGHRRTLKLCHESYNILREVVIMQSRAWLIQQHYRAYSKRQAEALARSNAAAQRIFKQYLEEKHTNYVRLEWEAERRKEKEALEAAYKEQQQQMEIAMVEQQLRTVLPFGWEKVWKEAEQQNQDDGKFVYRMVGKRGRVIETEERPAYTFEDDRAVRKVQAIMRINVAKLALGRLKRAKKRKMLEEANQRVWASKERERNQNVSLRMQIVVRPAAYLFRIDEGKDAEEQKVMEGQLAAAIDTESEIRVGMPVHARYGGLNFYYPGYIYQINPTQYTTTEGIKSYPKGTYGVLYEDGDYEPAVPLSLIRVLRVKKGMKVEARYRGGEAYYPGVVIDINERDGVAISYQVRYDDGDVEKAVRRSCIRLLPQHAMRINQRIDHLLQEREDRKAWRKQRAERVIKKKAAWESKQTALIEKFGKLMLLKSPKPSGGEPSQWESSLQEVMDLADVSKQLRDLRRRHVCIKLQVQYTRMPLPYGWEKKVDAKKDNQVYYEFLPTGQRKKIAPTYNCVDDVAARRVQTIWRAFAGRRKFLKMLGEETPVGVARNAVRDGAKHAWVGYGEEGMTVEMWLNRLGLSYLLPTKAGAKLLGLGLEKLRKMDDQDLQSLGMVEERDRKVMLQTLARTPQAMEDFKLINYYSGPSDPRYLVECILQSRDRIMETLLKAYPGNNKRVEKMADAMATSGFPISHAQLKAFITKYSGKAAAAQDNLFDIVNVRTTSCMKNEQAVLDMYKRAAKRICTLLANLAISSLRDMIQEALAQAEAIVQLGAMAVISSVPPSNASFATSSILTASSYSTASSRPGTSATGGGGSPTNRSRSSRTSSSDRSSLPGRKEKPFEPLQLSGPEGKAAMVLRIRCFEKVLKYEESAHKIQTKYRGYRARKAYNKIMGIRESSTLKLQSLWRKFKVRSLRYALIAQQQSQWEQLWSTEEKCFYYYNKVTGESVWEEPGEPYRPMVRDTYTGKLIQAWPFLDWPPVVEKKATKGKCMKCFVREANRRCNKCFFKKTKDDWNKGYGYYCFGCYADLHKDDPVLREHGFTAIKPVNPPRLKCSVCNGHASRRCHGIRINQRIRDELTKLMAEARFAEDPKLRLEEFTEAMVERLHLNFSFRKIEMLYEECYDPEVGSRYEAWQKLSKVIDNHQEACEENYCANCWADSHKKGQRAKHRWEGFREDWMSCASCEREPARRTCQACEDNLCESCFIAAHIRGRKRNHHFVELKEPLEPEEVPCSHCSWRVGTVQCQDCYEALCDSCHAFEHKDECKAWLEVKNDKGVVDHLVCCVCGEVPDTECVECGDVYCSNSWAGNPGCFVKMHRKGNRKSHVRRPYLYVYELREQMEQKQLKEMEETRIKVDEEYRRVEALEATNRRVHQILATKQAMRQKRLEEEAQAEFEKKMGGKSATAALSALLGAAKTKTGLSSTIGNSMGLTAMWK